MRRFGDGWWTGITFALLAACIMIGVAAWTFGSGVDTGKERQHQEYERQGGGRYVEMKIDGYTYRGWLR